MSPCANPIPESTGRHDVAILGGGPAGSHLALRLARLGWRVALIEARTFPRAKPCGEFMSPECLGLLEEVGLLRPVVAAGACAISRMELNGFGSTARGGYMGRTLRPGTYVHGLALRREILDEISLRAAARAAGVTLYEGRRAVGLLRDAGGRIDGARLAPRADGVEQDGTEEIRADFTIGADGLRSLVAREMGVYHGVEALKKLAFVYRLAGVAPQHHAEVHFVDRGYLIAAPVDEGMLTLNLIIERPVWRGGVDKWTFLCEQLRQAPALQAKLRGARLVGDVLATGPLASTTDRQVFDGAALVGDACGFVDPLTGEGLFFAMRGAALLAGSLDRALTQGRRDARALAPYARARRREFGPRLLLARGLQRCLRKPDLAARMLAFLAARPRLMDLILTVTGDSVSPLRVLAPRILLPALRQRAKATRHRALP